MKEQSQTGPDSTRNLKSIRKNVVKREVELDVDNLINSEITDQDHQRFRQGQQNLPRKNISALDNPSRINGGASQLTNDV